jgi:pentatricopeptide repeat protein
MFRSVKCVHWHRLQLAPPVRVSSPTCSLLYQSIRQRWSMEAVAEGRAHIHPSRNSHKDLREDRELDAKDYARPGPISTNRRVHAKPPHDKIRLPRELLDAISIPLRYKRDWVSALERLRSSDASMAHFQDSKSIHKLIEDLARTAHPARITRVLHLAHHLGCDMKQNVYETAAFHLAGARQWHLVLSVVSQGNRQSGKTTLRLLNWYTRALVETEQYGRVGDILSWFESESLRPTRRTFHLIVTGQLRNADLFGAKETLGRMEADGFPIDASTHALVISVYRSLGPDVHIQRQAFETLRVVGHNSTRTLNGLLQLAIDAQDSQSLKAVLSLFDPRKLGTALLQEPENATTPPAGGSLDRGTSGERPSTPAQPYNVPPDLATFSLLLNYTINEGNLQGGFHVVKMVERSGLRVDDILLASLIRLYFMDRDEGTALSLVLSTLDPNKIPSSLFASLALPPARQRVSTDLVSRMEPSVRVFNTFLRGILPLRGLSGARIVLRILRLAHLAPDAYTVEIILEYLERTARLRPREIIKLLRLLSISNISPTQRHAHIILRSILRREKAFAYGVGWNVAAARFSKERKASSARQLIKNSSTNPNPILSDTHDTLEPAGGIQLSKSRRVSLRRVFRPSRASLRDRKMRSDRATLALRIKHEAVTKSDLGRARDTFSRMLARGMHANKYHFSALMEGHVRAGDLDTARRIMQAAAEKGIKPNVVMYTILIVGHAHRGEPKLATRVFEEMVQSGVAPDVPAIDALVSAYFIVGAYRTARGLLVELWTTVAPFPEELKDASLQMLAKEFRTRYSTKKGSSDTRMSQQEMSAVRSKLKKLAVEWKAWTRTASSSSSSSSSS